ncbi:PAS domain S-box protein [Scytonema sp. PCC 10023]|uniref:PAS domain S-box protein n=1 Tax=Scytonema sp. PCC 10023 TaxID=1680591 RepID=UPI0039C647E0
MCKVNERSKISQHLSMALEAAKMVIWEWDLLTNCVVWSSSQEELFGLAPGSFPETYESAIARVHPSDLEAATLCLNQARVERHDYHQELRIFGSDGSIHWIEAKGRFFYNDEGQAVRMLGTVMEISDRKAREEQLRLLQSVVVHTNDGVIISEANPTDPMASPIVYANPAFTQMTGYTLEEVLGKTSRILQGEKTDPATLDKIRTARQSGQPVQVEGINYTKDGREFWVEVNIFPIEDESNQVTHWVSVGRDITERKQTEAALKESEERFRQIAENIQDVFWILDPQKREIVYISPVYERIWGRKCESLYATRMDWMNSIHPDDTERVQAILGDKVHTELFEHEYRIVRPDGTVRWIRDRGFPVKDELGQLQRITGIAEDITEQKLSEVALRESEERFRHLAENIEDVFWISDPTKPQLLYISPAYEKIWGRSIESLYASNINFINSTHPDDREAVLATFVEKSHLEVFEHEYRIVRPDGTVRWIRDRGFPVKDEGQVKYITGIAQDITERKLAEAALQQLNEELEIRIKQRTVELERSQLILEQQLRREQLIKRLTQQIRQSLDLEIILNTVVTEVQKLLASDRVLVHQIQPDGTGSIVAEAVVGDWTRILHQKFPEEIFPERSQKRDLEGQIYTLTNRDNEEILPCFADFLAKIQVRAELVVPIIQQDTVWGLLIVHECSEPREWQTWEIDLLKQLSSQVAIAIQQSELYQQLKEELRDRQRAEVALRQSEALFRSLTEFAPVGIFRCDAQGQIIYTNPHCQAIFGYTFEEGLGYGWMQFLHPEDLETIMPQWAAAVAAKQGYRSEIRCIHKDKTIRFGRTMSVPIFCESGELTGYVGIVEDITESRAIEKMKKEFISIVSHELRTPLTAIRGSLGLLAAGVLKDQPDTAKQMLEIAAKDTERLVRLVNDILDLERLEANKVFFVKQWCDATTLMHQSLKTVQFLAVENKITLCVVPSSVQVWADSDRMIQTLVNLLSNAIKFSPTESTVTLSVQALPDHVLFKIQDQGRGIPHDQLKTIFRRFQQVDASDSRQKGGTGLGLAICRSIVQQHGGRIWAESVLGLGTVFYFTLPQPLES